MRWFQARRKWKKERKKLKCIVCFVSGSHGYIYSTRAFIYSLKNYNGYGYFKKDVYYPSYATYSYYDYGPTFGGGHDIKVADYANSNYNSYFNCHSYISPYCNNYMWTGNYNFCADEIEIYYEAISAIWVIFENDCNVLTSNIPSYIYMKTVVSFFCWGYHTIQWKARFQSFLERCDGNCLKVSMKSLDHVCL